MLQKFIPASLAIFLSLDVAYGAADEFPRDLVEGAMLASPRIQTIQKDGVARRQAEERELSDLLHSIRERYETGEVDLEVLKSGVREGLENDRAYFTALNAQLAPFEVGKGKTTFQLKSNKMVEGCTLALDLLASEFDNILEGRLPHGYSFESPLMNFVGDENHPYSSGRGIALEHLLVKAALVLAGGGSVEDVLKAAGVDPAVSPWVHYTPLPDELVWEDLEVNPYFAARKDGRFIGIVHNGYTYGGHRSEVPKEWGPHDCSSFVAKYTGTPPEVTTGDQFIRHQLEMGYYFAGVPNCGAICAKWEAEKAKLSREASVQSLMERTTPIPLERIQAGSIHAFRTFPDLEKGFVGAAGHTTFVLGVEGQGPDAKVWTIGASRNLPDVDGIYVIDPFPLMTDPVTDLRRRMTMYFDDR